MSTKTEDDATPDVLPADLATLLDDFVRLEKKRRELEESLDDCTKQISRIQEPLVELFAMNGLQNCKKDGLTVFIKRDRYVSRAKGVEAETVVSVLRGIGRDYMVSESYNPASLKSLVKEYEDSGQEIPPNLAACLSMGEVSKLATRRA